MHQVNSNAIEQIINLGRAVVPLWDRPAVGDIIMVECNGASALVRVDGEKLHECNCGSCDPEIRSVLVRHDKPRACDYHAGYFEAGCIDCAEMEQ